MEGKIRVIVVKPKGKPFPSGSLLSDCFRHNPLGAGVMFAASGNGLIKDND